MEQNQNQILVQVQVARNANVVDRPMGFYSMPSLKRLPSGIFAPPLNVNCFELKPSIISMIQNSYQFGGLPFEDQNSHLSKISLFV